MFIQSTLKMIIAQSQLFSPVIPATKYKLPDILDIFFPFLLAEKIHEWLFKSNGNSSEC